MVGFIRALQDYDNPNSLASKMRRGRARFIRPLIERAFAKSGACRILDLGGRPEYWRIFEREFLEAHRVHVTTVNLEDQAESGDPMFAQVRGDACALDIDDGAFDLTHSNSVLEHVGTWGDMERFAGEMRRTGKRYYAQTPYFWFPIEPHFSAPFFHWLPESTRARLLLKRAHGFMTKAADMGEAMRAVQHAQLVSRAQFQALFPDAEHRSERFAGLTKSLVAYRG